MAGLLSDDVTKSQQADEPWLKKETDLMLDLYFSGTHPKRIAYQLQRNVKAILRRLEQFTYNERGWVERYQPAQRISRKGQRLTENERVLIKAHAEREIPLQDTARVMARAASELDLSPSDPGKLTQFGVLAPTLDLLLAARHVFHSYKECQPIMSDKDYDDLKAEEIELGNAEPFYDKITKSPERVKTLALYLVQRMEDEKTAKKGHKS